MLLTLSVLAVSGALASSNAARMEPAFTATILSTYPDGGVSRLWLSPDGSFTAEEKNHDHKAGHWTLKGASLCLHQTKPYPIPLLAYCSPLPPAGAGASWTGKAVTGEPITIRLVPGR